MLRISFGAPIAAGLLAAAMALACPTSIAVAQVPGPGGLPLVVVLYSAGWNIVGPHEAGQIFASSGPFYTLQAGDQSYEVVAAVGQVQPGLGYWAYLSNGSNNIIRPLSTCPDTLRPEESPADCAFSMALPPGQWIMVGNPWALPAAITGADSVYTYSPESGYTQSNRLEPGYGAFVYSAEGGTVTVTPG